MSDYEYSFQPASKKQWQLLQSDAQIVVYGGSMGAGKALRHGTPVLTKSGWKNIEDLKVGDLVWTPTERWQSITGVFPQGEVDIYRLHFNDRVSVDTCGEHLWEVMDSEVAKVLLELIKRVQIGGAEVDTYVYVRNVLNDIANPTQEEPAVEVAPAE